jgi:hypothetical protein
LATLGVEARHSLERLGRPFVADRFGQQQMMGHLFERGVVLMEQARRFSVSSSATDRIDLDVHR